MYVKLFESILRSSVWYEPEHVRLVWITLLLMADRDGYVEGVPRSIATAANVDYTRTREALQLLEAPDLDSKSQEWAGRRIEKVEGGWLILNYSKYRGFRTLKDVETVRRKRAEREVPKADGSDSYVYYARSNGNRVKIGCSMNPWSRCNELRTADPSVTLIVVERGDRTLERERHEQFKAQHLEREWFALDGPLVSHIEELQRRSGRSSSVANDDAVAAATSVSASASASESGGRGAGEGATPEVMPRDVPTWAGDWTDAHWRAYAALTAKHGHRAGMDALLASAFEAGLGSGLLGETLVELWQAGAPVSKATLEPFARRIQKRGGGPFAPPAIAGGGTARKGWCVSCTGDAATGHRRGCPFGVADTLTPPPSLSAPRRAEVVL